MERPGLVLVHGAGLGGWIWREVTPRLTVPALAVELPGRGSPPASTRGLRLADYAAHVARRVEAWRGGDVVLVAHSIGGVIALETAGLLGRRVAGLVAVGAAIPGAGGSFLSVLPWPQRLLLGILLRVVGTRPPESAIRQGLCSDLEPTVADEVVARFVPESRKLYTDRTRPPLPAGPRLYVKLTGDRELAPALQDRMARRLGGEVVELPTGHLPMLAAPGALAGVLEAFAIRAGRER